MQTLTGKSVGGGSGGFRVIAEVDVESVIQMLDDCHPVAERAAASALNKAAAKARTQATRDIANEYQVKPQRIVRNRMRLWKASKKDLFVRLRFLLRGIPVVIQSGVTYYGAEGSGVSTPQGHMYDAWVMQSKKGKQRKHVFRRAGKTSLPINAQYIRPSKSFCQFAMWRRLKEQAPTVAAEIVRQITLRINGDIKPSRHEGAGS